jgi:hypothetical protein
MKHAKTVLVKPNDEIERRAGALSTNEADLSQSSTSSLTHRRRDPCSLQQGCYAAAIERNVPAAVNRGLLAGRNSELEGLAYGVAAACHPLEYMVCEGVVPEALEYESQTLAGGSLIQGIECGDQSTSVNRRK